MGPVVARQYKGGRDSLTSVSAGGKVGNSYEKQQYLNRNIKCEQEVTGTKRKLRKRSPRQRECQGKCN